MRHPTDWFLEMFLLLLRPVVYSGSSFLAKIALSLYGFIHSISIVRRKRLSAVKSLISYGVAVVQKRLASKKEA